MRLTLKYMIWWINLGMYHMVETNNLRGHRYQSSWSHWSVKALVIQVWLQQDLSSMDRQVMEAGVQNWEIGSMDSHVLQVSRVWAPGTNWRDSCLNFRHKHLKKGFLILMHWKATMLVKECIVMFGKMHLQCLECIFDGSGTWFCI